MYEKELQQLGLSEKEAKVYSASLELGPTSVIEISKRASLKRPTTYYAIEELIRKGLMSFFEKGKKRYFSAESPERLLSLIIAQKRKVAALEEELQKVLPGLNNIFDLAGERPKVRFFEGKEGIKAIQEDILKSKFKSIEEFVPLDEAYKIFPPSFKDHRQKLAQITKNIPRRTIYISQKGAFLPQKGRKIERRFIPPQKFPFSIELTIYGNKTAIVAYRGKLIGTVIESQEIADSLRIFFNLAWKAAESYQKEN